MNDNYMLYSCKDVHLYTYFLNTLPCNVINDFALTHLHTIYVLYILSES